MSSQVVPSPRRVNVGALAIALAIAVFGFLPIANWIPGGRAVPWFPDVMRHAAYGTLTVALVGIAAAIIAQWFPVLRPRHPFALLARSWERWPGRFALAVALAALATYVVIALRLFDGRPLLIDEIVQVYQARIYAHGALTRPADPSQSFFDILHMLDRGGRIFSQFPPGGPAMLALGALVGATWLVGPVFGALAVLLWAGYLRRAESRPGVAAGAVIVFAFMPFMAFMSGSHMNHVTTLTWTLLGMAALAAVVDSKAPRPWMALVCGLGFGVAGTIRPTDGFAFALPAGLWLLWRVVRDHRRWSDAVMAGIGVAIPMGIMLLINARTTGHPMLFGYEALWGKSHELGFHPAPWGYAHTPARGVELVNIYFLRLQSFLFELPMPSLVPIIVAIGLAPRFDRFDRYLLISSGLVVGLYFAYWHEGWFLGPRFMFPLIPVAALWAARVPALWRERIGAGLGYRAAMYALAASVLVTAWSAIPVRIAQYSGGFSTQRWDEDQAARIAGVKHALVFVRESWEAQLTVRLWALDVPHTQAEMLARNTDACALDSATAALEHSSVRGEAAFQALAPLLRDSSAVRNWEVAPEINIAVLPAAMHGAELTRRCLMRVSEDQSGVTPLASLLLTRSDNVFARDLQARDTVLLDRYPDRPVYLVHPPTSSLSDRPRYYAVSRDSLWRAWGVTPPSASRRISMGAERAK